MTIASPTAAPLAEELLPDLSASMEDYLEAIYELERVDSVARVKDIAERLNVATPSVSAALRALKEKGLVDHENYGHATLTAAGLQAAEQILRRHEAVVRFLHDILQLPRDQVEPEACALEHAVSAGTLKRLICLTEFIENCPRGGGDWLARLSGRWESFRCEAGRCAECIAGIAIPAVPRGVVAPDESARASLAAQAPGWRGKVVRVGGRGPIRRRLMEMGVTSGSSVEVERVAPLGDPLEVKVRGYHLSLRKEEAANIHVEPQ